MSAELAPRPASLDALRPEMDEAAQRYLRSAKAGGLAIGILFRGERHVFAYGEASPGQPVDADTMFEIGSITKVFTAILLAEMEERGELRVDDPVNERLPPEGQLSGLGAQITLRHLSTHTSGLPRLPSNLMRTVQDAANPYANYRPEDLHAFLSTHRLRIPPGHRKRYSNVGVATLGSALEAASGKSFGELVQERISEPLGLPRTFVSPASGFENRATGHASDGKETPHWEGPVMAASGRIESSVRDLLTFLEAQFEPPAGTLGAAIRRCQEAEETPLVRPQLDPGQWVAPGVAAALSLLMQQVWPVPPGSLAFAAVFLLPTLLASVKISRLAGFLMAAAMTGGAWLLWRDQFYVPGALALGALVAGFLGKDLRRRPMRERLGWASDEIDGETVLWHNGGTGGFSSYAAIVPAHQIAVVALASSERSVDDVPYALVKELIRESRRG